jgi:hypothetical protein
MRSLLLAAVLLAACGNDKPNVAPGHKDPTVTKTDVPADPPKAPGATGSAHAEGSAATAMPDHASDVPAPPQTTIAAGGHDFTAEGKALLAVGACGEGAAPDNVTAKALERHCGLIKKTQDAYITSWLSLARPFFAEKVPKDIPKKVVYPFAGGDLSTALTVYPDADEITTISLEPAGDPRTLSVLKGKALDTALQKIEYELKFLYRVNFSNTLNMIAAMRGGRLPTQLIFGLSALKIHGFELVALRYFRLNDDGSIHYLDDDDIKKAPDAAKDTTAEQRNYLFSNAEVQFRRPNGRIQVWRHMRHNLGNDASKGIGPGLKEDTTVIKHLERKGPIAAMTKAASYLLSWASFSIIRNYLTANVVWMVSDATGIAPKWGKPAGFEYETYGGFKEPHIPAGSDIAKNWRTEFAAQPKRELKFRFGYYDKNLTNHLVIMRKKP